MKKLQLLIASMMIAGFSFAQLSGETFVKKCTLMGLKFSPAAIQNNFKALQLDSIATKQYDYAIMSNDGMIAYRYRLLPSVKDSSNAAFAANYFLNEAAKTNGTYPAIHFRAFPKGAIENNYNCSGGFSSFFTPGDAMRTTYKICNAYAIYKEGSGLLIIIVLANEDKVLDDEKYAGGLIGLLSFK